MEIKMRPAKKEKSKIMYLRIPESWHKTLQQIAEETGQDIVVLLRPYIRFGLQELEKKYKKNEII